MLLFALAGIRLSSEQHGVRPLGSDSAHGALFGEAVALLVGAGTALPNAAGRYLSGEAVAPRFDSVLASSPGMSRSENPAMKHQTPSSANTSNGGLLVACTAGWLDATGALSAACRAGVAGAVGAGQSGATCYLLKPCYCASDFRSGKARPVTMPETKNMTWARMARLTCEWLPAPCCFTLGLGARMAVRRPGERPYRRIGHGQIYAVGESASSPRSPAA